MSGVYIPGMEMPKKKNGAVLIIYPDGTAAFEDGMKYNVVPVPNHGRLIDADALKQELRTAGIVDTYGTQVLLKIDNATTIFPADKDGEKDG